MNQSFLEYIDRMELMVFFCGYPLLYAIILFTGNFKTAGNSNIKTQLIQILPYTYALTGTFYIGLMLKNMAPGITTQDLVQQFAGISLRTWGLLSLIFWIPFFNRKPVFSLLHSLVFFYFLLADIIRSFGSNTAADLVRNDMKIYFTSILINVATFIVVAISIFTWKRLLLKKRSQCSPKSFH